VPGTARSPAPPSLVWPPTGVQGFETLQEQTLPPPSGEGADGGPCSRRALSPTTLTLCQRVAGAACGGDRPGRPPGPSDQHQRAPAARPRGRCQACPGPGGNAPRGTPGGPPRTVPGRDPGGGVSSDHVLGTTPTLGPREPEDRRPSRDPPSGEGEEALLPVRPALHGLPGGGDASAAARLHRDVGQEAGEGRQEGPPDLRPDSSSGPSGPAERWDTPIRSSRSP